MFYGLAGSLIQLLAIIPMVLNNIVLATILFFVGLLLIVTAFRNYLPDYYVEPKLVIPFYTILFLTLPLLILSLILLTIRDHFFILSFAFFYSILFLIIVCYSLMISYLRLIVKLFYENIIPRKTRELYRKIYVVIYISFFVSATVLSYLTINSIGRNILHPIFSMGLPALLYVSIKFFETMLWYKLWIRDKRIFYPSLRIIWRTLLIILLVLGSLGMVSEYSSLVGFSKGAELYGLIEYNMRWYIDLDKPANVIGNITRVKLYSMGGRDILVNYVEHHVSYTIASYDFRGCKYFVVNKPYYHISLGPIPCRYMVYGMITHIWVWSTDEIYYDMSVIGYSSCGNYAMQINSYSCSSTCSAINIAHFDIPSYLSIYISRIVPINEQRYVKNLSEKYGFQLLVKTSEKIVYKEQIFLNINESRMISIYCRYGDCSILLTNFTDDLVYGQLYIYIVGFMEGSKHIYSYYIYPKIHYFQVNPYYNPSIYFVASALIGEYLDLPYPSLLVIASITLYIMEKIALSIYERMRRRPQGSPVHPSDAETPRRYQGRPCT